MTYENFLNKIFLKIEKLGNGDWLFKIIIIYIIQLMIFNIKN